MKPLHENQFNSEVVDQPGLSFIMFSAVWCGPCKSLQPLLRAWLHETAHGIDRSYIVDSDESPELANQHNIRSFPTFVLYKNSVKLGTYDGTATLEQVVAWIEDTKKNAI